MGKTTVKSLEVELLEMFYYSMNGQIYDLSQEFTSISITESIDSPFMKGTVEFMDVNDLGRGYQMYTGGYLKVKYRTNSDFPTLTQTFWVYKAGNDKPQEVTQPHNRRFVTLYFASVPIRDDMFEKYSLFYKQQYVSDIVAKVSKDLLGIELASVDKTLDQISIVVPYWNPMQIINYCIKKSYSQKHEDTGYVFFENNDGHHYVSLSELLSKKPEIECHFNAYQMDRNKNIPASSVNYINNYQVIKHADVLESMMSYRFGGSIHWLDWEDKRWQEKTHTYNSAYLDKTWTLGKKSTTTNEFSNPKMMHTGYYGGFPDYFLSPLSRYNMMNDNAHFVQMAGDTRKKAGQIINFEYLNKDKGQSNMYNDFLKGNYMIRSITHNFNVRLQYTVDMILVKDAYFKDGENCFNIGAKVNGGKS